MKCPDCKQELTGDDMIDREVHGRCSNQGAASSEPQCSCGNVGPEQGIPSPLCKVHGKAWASSEPQDSANVHIEHYFPKGYDPNEEPWKSIKEHHNAALKAARMEFWPRHNQP